MFQTQSHSAVFVVLGPFVLASLFYCVIVLVESKEAGVWFFVFLGGGWWGVAGAVP